MNRRVLPASCRQRDRRKALSARCRQHIGGTLSLVRGSCSQCMPKNERGLSRNHSSQIRMTNDEIRRNDEIRSTKPANAPLRVFRRSGFGFHSSFNDSCKSVSWSQCMRKNERGLSMNRPGHRIAASLGKAALKTHALQTLSRGPLTRPRARSVWSASDLSALFVRRGTASGSWSQCRVVRPSGLSMNLVAAVPAASCGGVSPPARTPGETPGALAGEDACATSAARFMVPILAENERRLSEKLTLAATGFLDWRT
jgi:hypothetical protein